MYGLSSMKKFLGDMLQTLCSQLKRFFDFSHSIKSLEIFSGMTFFKPAKILIESDEKKNLQLKRECVSRNNPIRLSFFHKKDKFSISICKKM